MWDIRKPSGVVQRLVHGDVMSCMKFDKKKIVFGAPRKVEMYGRGKDGRFAFHAPKHMPLMAHPGHVVGLHFDDELLMCSSYTPKANSVVLFKPKKNLIQ